MASTSTFRKLILNLHLWVGLVAAVLLLFIGGSGALLVFETQIDQALNPKLSRVTPTGTMLSPNGLKIALERQYPGYRVLELGISESNDTAYEAYLQPASGDGIDVAVDSYSGKALGVWDDNRFARKLHEFHTHLLAGKTGSAVVAGGAIFLLFLSLSGLILWWRSKVFGFSFQSSGPKFRYDLHGTIGIVSSLFLLAFSLTGIVVHWEDAAGRWAKGVSHMPAEPPHPHPAKPAPELHLSSQRNCCRWPKEPFPALAPRQSPYPTVQPVRRLSF